MSNTLLAYTILHVVISLIGIATGFIWMAQWLKRTESKIVVNIFLSMTILTSVSGFGFPATEIKPGHVLGVISLVILGITLYAKYSKRLADRWLPVYLVTATIAQYLNVLVLIVQSFQKVAPLRNLAPTQTELPFVTVQLATLLAFTVYTVVAVGKARAKSFAG
jgi:hypothetical protein